VRAKAFIKILDAANDIAQEINIIGVTPTITTNISTTPY